ncbi:holo-ACP synthase [Virgibacillus soli]|uniref:Holo-[acyl-carrier-protein] synthase n=1 Tax=Paracerasibacillus soli TaxID=480284 RepID=A0ABU5CS22_9BACI|nr:holo-ACP synthase [Virgibacillus soli]MDY0409176.1 holo-ACP synthase [Virgibacillus soli]
MILGIGMDLVEIARMKKACERSSLPFVKRILTEQELDMYHALDSERRKVEWLSGRFAAKEALAKAIGTGFGKELSFQDITIMQDTRGKPTFQLHPKIEARYQHATTFHLSITHTAHYAASFVIIELGSDPM